MTVPRHVVEFCVNDFEADFALDSDRRKSVRFAAGSAGFAPKGASLFRASTCRPDRSRSHKFIGISFDTDTVDRLFRDIVDTSAIEYFVGPSPAIIGPLREIGWHLNNAFDVPGGVAAITMEALSHQYCMQALLRWSSIGERIRRPSCRGKHPDVARCIDYIQAHVARPIWPRLLIWESIR